ncbi:Serine/threonine-protein phosphatase with EF-hands pef-1 [Trichoplax sp. H2]|nr:Serine/threonine-protein phosphatase with EF-hands pef-1 [Trichoplax sp. H2]|eukprot:RDD46763.1 Serine/threonine-protein phosphatase with EF-hands pef-1 [Trichoplax sp. H2]
MGCGPSHPNTVNRKADVKVPSKGNENVVFNNNNWVCKDTSITVKSAILIQNWFRRYKARLEARKRCTWSIFQQIEFAGEQDQLKLYNFFNGMIDQVKISNANITNGRRSSSIANVLAPISNSYLEEEAQLVQATDPDSVIINKAYQGPHINMPITLDQVKELIEAFSQDKILHAKYLLEILHEARRTLKLMPNVSQASTVSAKRITICGDLHGKIDDLLLIFYKNGLPSYDNPYIFNGDFVDRGEKSVEIAILLLCFFLLYPNETYINRGNHEDHIMNIRYGFLKEVISKYKRNASKVVKMFEDVFSWLPLATIIDNKIFVTHGGISDQTDVHYLNVIDRHKYISVLRPSLLDEEDGEEKIDLTEWRQVLDVLWSDPKNANGCKPNEYRGGGSYFGPDVTRNFLSKHNFNLIIRSHECKIEGWEYMHYDKVLTVFSASNYYSPGSNKGAYLKLNDKHEIECLQFMSDTNYGNKNLSMREKMGIIEESALREIQSKFHSHRMALEAEFKAIDTEETGCITIDQWIRCLVNVLELELPWRRIKHQIVNITADGMVQYHSCFDKFSLQSALKSKGPTVTETLYKHKNSLETIFRIIDKDNSGLISMEEFQDSCLLLDDHVKSFMSKEDIHNLAKSIDFNNDGHIDFNEFLEAFRLVSKEQENDNYSLNGVSDNQV